MAGGLSATLNSVACSLDAMLDAMNCGLGSALESRLSFVDHAFISLRYTNQAEAADKDRN